MTTNQSNPEPAKLTRNAIKCLRCNDVIESKSLHDYVKCKCLACFVDGGLVAPRYGSLNVHEVQDMAEFG